jgi:alpha-beta hydrolase superfamily lysophospholipase
MPITYGTSWRAAAIVFALWLATVAALSGPLFPFTPQPSGLAVARAADLDLYLRRREAQHPDVRPDLAKTILWNDRATRAATALSLVYIHGFSASRKDITPVVETLASRLHANAFFTRLAAHGSTGAAEFATVRAQDWLDDAREALAIGRRIGDRVVLIGTSTGALLATMAALEDDSRVPALVLLSPNFGIRDWRAKFIAGPLGPLLARIIIGSEYSFRPDSPGHAEFWTSRYPSQAIVALMDLVNYGRALHLDHLKVPTLIIYTGKDTVVDPRAIEERFDEIATPPKRLVDLPEASRHELTGDALAPETVQPVVRQIMTFLAASGVVGPTSAAGKRCTPRTDCP